MVRLPLLLLSALSLGDASVTDPNLSVLLRIINHNFNTSSSFTMRYHEIADLSPEEYKKRLGLRVPAVRPKSSKTFQLEENFVVPDSLDWRDQGVVSPIKDQKDCGSCWAFSAVGALEGQHAKRNGTLVELSEQNLVDCSTENGGCNGGLPVLAFKYVMKNGGIDTEESYPYHAKDETCHFSKESVGETDEGYAVLPEGDEEVLKQAVAAIGPISVGIDASQDSFRNYGGGVYYDPECGSQHQELNHAVLVVGYGTDTEHGDYWLVKNSYGTKFGEEGYIRMARNRDNNCGIATFASYPIVM